MVETRRSTAAKSKTKTSAPPKQRTLFDLFPAKSIPTNSTPAEQVIENESAPPAPSTCATSSNTEDREEMTMAPVVEKLRQTSLEPRPLHPFFMKLAPSLPTPPLPAEPLHKQDTIIEIEDDETPSGPCYDSTTHKEESGSREDPIQIMESPIQPLRPAKPIVSSSKPLAPLFAARRPKAAPAPSSPASELPDEAVKPKLAPIFTPRSSKAAPSPSNLRLAKTKEVVAPFPNKETQHVRGPQQVFSASDISFGRRAKHESSSISSVIYEAGSLKQFLTKKNMTPSIPTPILNKDSYLDSIPDEHRKHPAISRFTTGSQPEGSAHRLWVDKWRPIRAAEVLGNEENAIYLRDWIHALELQLETSEEQNNVKGKGKAKTESSRGTKRPRTVVREVGKKRGKKKRRVDSEDDSWIVYDEDYFSSPAPSSPLPQDGASSPVSRTSPLDLGCLTANLHHAQHTFTSLTNTILLAGPSGSGKTAAVYACAEELGWDVLEVYPGIGKRNGAGIDSLIGDAGKNHHVRKARTGVVGTSDRFGGFKEKGDDGVEPAGDAPASVRQSLILLEEVDILFKDDTSFWPAVTNFIKDCKRPVICTCNDMSLVPTQDLPLQTILTFQPCSAQLVASYLQTLCFQEDCVLLNRERLLRLYKDSASKVEAIDLPDMPNPAGWGDFPGSDLRRTINNLQFVCASGNETGWEEDMCHWDGPWGKDLSADQAKAELFSYVDTYLRRRPWEMWSICEATKDDEVGHRMLFWGRASIGETEIGSWLSRGETSVAADLFRARVDHQVEIEKGLEGIVPLDVVVMRGKEVHMDYVSMVRWMVEVDDELEKKYMGGGRMTRNSGGVYSRQMMVRDAWSLRRTMLSQI